MISWGDWWVWAVAALILAVGEVILPSFLLLGFAIGAGVVAILLALGIPLAANVFWLLVVFSTVSLIAWLVLRWTLGMRKGQVKKFDHDIND